MKLAAKLTLGLAGLVLLGGIALAVLGTRPPPEPKFKGRLIDLLPTAEELPGWTVEHLPIADTPEMQEKISEELNFDDSVFVVYRKGVTRFSIYAAYWKPGTMPHRLIGGHTPDVCWIRSGWQRLAARTGFSVASSAGSLPAGGEYRLMLRGDVQEHVVFWHFLDGRPKAYEKPGLPVWNASLKDGWEDGLNQRPEQFFVRISSPEPVSEWSNTDVMQRFASTWQSSVKW